MDEDELMSSHWQGPAGATDEYYVARIGTNKEEDLPTVAGGESGKVQHNARGGWEAVSMAPAAGYDSDSDADVERRSVLVKYCSRRPMEGG